MFKSSSCLLYCCLKELLFKTIYFPNQVVKFSLKRRALYFNAIIACRFSDVSRNHVVIWQLTSFYPFLDFQTGTYNITFGMTSHVFVIRCKIALRLITKTYHRGVAEDRTLDFSHAKRTLYHWVTTPLFITDWLIQYSIYKTINFLTMDSLAKY